MRHTMPFHAFSCLARFFLRLCPPGFEGRVMRARWMSAAGRWLLNVGLLTGKELRSLARDPVLVALIVFAFTFAIVSIAHGIRADVFNASVAVVDDDRSSLSLRLHDAIRPPHFKPPALIALDQAAPGMDAGEYIFVVQFPPGFEADTLAGRRPAVQVLVEDRKSTRLNSSHRSISYAVFCLKKKNKNEQ